MKTRIAVIVMALALALYIYFVAQRGVIMVQSGDPLGITIGVALLVLPLIGAWALWRELRFGRDAQRLGETLANEGSLPEEQVDVHPSGRPKKEDGDRIFPKYRAAVEERPNDWRAWYRLGVVYDAAGDRTRARQAIRKAISVEKTSV